MLPSAMDSYTQEPMNGFHIEKEVFDAGTAIWLSGPLHDASELRPFTDEIEGMVVLLLDQDDPPSKEDATCFASLVEGAHRPIYVARAPPPLIFAWTATDMPANARIVSVMAPLGCPRCGFKLDRELQVEDFESGPEFSCPRDGAKLKLSLSMKKRKMLASLLNRELVSLHLWPPNRMTFFRNESYTMAWLVRATIFNGTQVFWDVGPLPATCIGSQFKAF